jgi:hypothetical protein
MALLALSGVDLGREFVHRRLYGVDAGVQLDAQVLDLLIDAITDAGFSGKLLSGRRDHGASVGWGVMMSP